MVAQRVRKIACKARVDLHSKRYRELAEKYDISGYKRVYCVHIRKTGGTSLNNMFFSLSGAKGSILQQQIRHTKDHRIVHNGKIYVGWNACYINGGHYFYGYSHIPLHKLKLPKKTFTVTCFRDPVKRVVSHYNMLMGFRENGIKRPCMRVEGKWLGNRFEDFLDRIPSRHLMNQLYMFSASYDVEEAVDRAARLSHYFFARDFQSGIDKLNNKTGLALKPVHVHKSAYQEDIPEDALVRLRDMLDSEYRFLERVKKLKVA